ncbi:MAG: CDP-glycerol glycerophosphotransferase family protein [Helicobacter sp.]|uniref:CDP-glycerol glycerophosphotransferase family protein n=1 Tax=Helicobacter sp. TaxID=218 RepID=UPI002A7EC7C6|nr:CDP-glycerol glycerophosphotransferase family protein [Helicobacter sp.]MDY4427245.1 CDP-glycerol glycerophosphotransferase family protein [Helicobacter sp.]
MVKYFIYPQGANGVSIAEFIDIYYRGIKYFFIDDKDSSKSLDKSLAKIGKQDIVLNASSRYYDKLANKLEENNLNYINGIKWCGDCINNKITEIKRETNKQFIGIVISNQFIENHFVGIDRDLKNLGYEIIYFVFTRELYDKYIKKGLCFFAPHSILEEIVGMDLMILANGEPTSDKVVSVDLTHGYQGMSIIPFMQIDNFFMYKALSKLNYKIAGSKRICDIDRQYFDSLGVDTKILPCGYLKLDKDSLEYEEYMKQYPPSYVIDEEYVIIAFTFCNDLNIYKLLIKAISKAQKKIVILPHPVFAEEILKKLEHVIKDNGIFLKKDFNSKMEIFALSCCLITDCSSMGYTYPLTTKKPTIIFSKDRDRYFESNHSRGYFDTRIHYFCSDSEEVEIVLKEIAKNKQNYENRIVDYRKNECFHFGNSKKQLLAWIDKYLKER